MLKQCHEYRLPLYHNQFAVGGNTLSILFFVFSLKMQSVNKELHQRFKESATKSVRSFLFKSRHKEQWHICSSTKFWLLWLWHFYLPATSFNRQKWDFTYIHDKPNFAIAIGLILWVRSLSVSFTNLTYIGVYLFYKIQYI